MKLTYSNVFIVDFVRKLALQTLVETRIFEFHFENRNEKIIKKDQLLKIGDLYKKMRLKIEKT